MNWSRAKTIMIVALICTNIFLIYTYIDFRTEEEGFQDTKTLAEFLSQKSIYVDPAIIPLVHSDMPVIYVYNQDGGCDTMNKMLAESVFRAEGERDNDYKSVAESMLGEAGPKYSTAEFLEILREEELVKAVYKNVVNGIRVEKSNVVFYFNQGFLENVVCNWLEVINYHQNPQRTISASQALLLFMAQRAVPGEIDIESIEMVYWLDESIHVEAPVSEDTALPVWKITYNEGMVEYIDAYEHN